MKESHPPSGGSDFSQESEPDKTSLTYQEAGVDIDLAHRLLGNLKSDIAKASRPEATGEFGGFGGLFNIHQCSRYSNPVLVSSIDGVGTKLMVAGMMDKYDGLGFDIVHHCVNDIAVQGAEPLYFLDYIGIGKLRSPLYEHVLSSIAKACAGQNVALLGGETAEMPGMYGQDFDLVGSITGVVDKDKVITGQDVAENDDIIGLASNGLHTNGYSLARKVLFAQANLPIESEPGELGESIGEALLKPHVCYWPTIKEMLNRQISIHGLAHITGGGWSGNIKRVLPPGLTARCRSGILPVPPIMRLIQGTGEIEDKEMYKAFNMGLGLACIVPPETRDLAIEICRETGFNAACIGKIEKQSETSQSEVPVIIE